MRRQLAFASVWIISSAIGAGAAQASCSPGSNESTAGLCGRPSDDGPLPADPRSCDATEGFACAGRLQRARDTAAVVIRYRALGRATIDYASRR